MYGNVKSPALSRELALRNNTFEHSFKIPRPFPIFEIFFETKGVTHPGRLCLKFRTPLGQGSIIDALSYVPWYKHLQKIYQGRRINYFFNLETCSIQEVKALFMGIFGQLITIAEIDMVQNSLHAALGKLLNMLDMYQTNFMGNFHGWNYYLNNQYEMYKKNNAENIDCPSASAERMFNAIVDIDTEKVLSLLKQGIDPNENYDGWTPLNASISVGIGFAVHSFKGRPKDQLLAEILSIIRLLLEYGANPMYESENHTAMEGVVISSFFSRYCTLEFYAAMLQILTAGKGIHPHMIVSEQEKKTGMGLIVSGVNCFLKELSVNSCSKILNCFKGKHLYFLTALNSCITVKTVILDSLTQKSRDFLSKNKELYELFGRIFPGQPASYLTELVENNTSAIDLIYMNNQLEGMNIVNISLIQAHKPFILHYIKLAVADKPLRAFQRFMSIISFARGFSLQKKFPMMEVVSYFEAASASGYLQTSNLGIYPKISESQEFTKCIAEHLYPNKLLRLKNSLLVQDNLGTADKPVAPLLFWDSPAKETQKLPIEINSDNVKSFFLDSGKLAKEGFRERYLQNKQKYSVIIGFFNNADNLKKLEQKISPHCSDTFAKTIDCYVDIGPDPVALKPARL